MFQNIVNCAKVEDLKMSDEILENLYDVLFKENVETHLREFIKKVSDIKTDSNYRVLYSVRVINLNTGNVIDIERDYK